jgi:hypothetical protein
MKAKVIGEMIGDRSVSILDRIMESRWCGRACSATIALAALYFGIGIFLSM